MTSLRKMFNIILIQIHSNRNYNPQKVAMNHLFTRDEIQGIREHGQSKHATILKV